MPIFSLKDHIKYLRDKRGVKENTLYNYVYAAKNLGITQVDTDDLPVLWARLTVMLPTRNPTTNELSNKNYGNVYKFRILVMSLLNLHNVPFESYEYNVLVDQLRQLRHVPIAYNEKQIRLLLKESKLGFGGSVFGLYRLLLFLTYTGCRVASVANVSVGSFETVDGVPGVYAVPVIGKGRGRYGHPYSAIIAKHAVEEMQRWNPKESDFISNWNGEVNRSSFGNYHRSQLAHIIQSRGLEEQITVDTAIFHSIRKFFSNKLAEDEVESDNISLLLGQIPNSLAYKAYVTSEGRNMSKVTIRIAKAYARTSFMTTKYWEDVNGSN